MCRDAEMAARDYVRLVMLGVGSVTDISVAQTLLRQAAQAVRRFADPAWRDEGLALTGRRPARPADRRRARQRRPARLHPGPGRRGHLRPAPEPAGQPARRDDHARGPDHRHRPALDPAAPPGQPGPGRGRARSTRSWPGTPPTPASAGPRPARAAVPDPASKQRGLGRDRRPGGCRTRRSAPP